MWPREPTNWCYMPQQYTGLLDRKRILTKTPFLTQVLNSRPGTNNFCRRNTCGIWKSSHCKWHLQFYFTSTILKWSDCQIYRYLIRSSYFLRTQVQHIFICQKASTAFKRPSYVPQFIYRNVVWCEWVVTYKRTPQHFCILLFFKRILKHVPMLRLGLYVTWKRYIKYFKSNYSYVWFVETFSYFNTGSAKLR